MEINLNNAAEFTIENVAKLIASKDDSEDRQIRVTQSGIAYLSDEVGNDNTDDLAFRLATWSCNNDYCGLKASKDEQHVAYVHRSLKENWPDPKSTYIDD